MACAPSEDPHVQADLSLCWAHMSFCRFCHALAHFYFPFDRRISSGILGNRVRLKSAATWQTILLLYEESQ